MTQYCMKCCTTNEDDANFCKKCGKKIVGEATCNLCGLSCALGHGSPMHDNHGMINKTVSGGYASTPGNGDGALDDGTSYTFSLCEFCLDWLFSQFKIPVTISFYMGSHEPESWRSASQRVAKDDWRKMKKEFTEEHDRRVEARKKT